MRLRGRQGRFVATSLGGWIAARAWLLWQAAPVAVVGSLAAIGMAGRDLPPCRCAPADMFVPAPTPRARWIAPAAARDAWDRRPPRLWRSTAIVRPATPPRPRGIGQALLRTMDRGYGFEPRRLLRRAVYADAAPWLAPARPRAPPFAPGRPIEGSVSVFERAGSGGAALAPGGSLGGSQVAARIAVALNRTGPVRAAVAVRLYAPLRAKGAEAAVGIDLHPLPGAPLRVSIERRVRLDHAGRDAWSAYAAGGFYREGLPLKLTADGYGQAGIVGLRARDPFVDGALRLGRRVELVGVRPILGAGLWGAAQPGAARLDIGPRAALTLPVADHALTLAIEGRLRVAGRAAPGSGVALTLAADL